jgi:invasion protein IalB
MTGMTSLFARLAVVAAIVSFGVLGAADAQAQSSETGWSKKCQNISGSEICSTENSLLTDSRQLITSVSFSEINGNLDQRFIQVLVPSGRLIAPGISMSIDGGQSRKFEYTMCLPDRCAAEAPLTDDLIDAFKRGSTVTFTVTNTRSESGSSSLSLAGFATAYDNQPGEPSDLTAIQQLLKDREAEFEAALEAASSQNGE